MLGLMGLGKLRSRVYGLGSRVQGLGFRVKGWRVSHRLPVRGCKLQP